MRIISAFIWNVFAVEKFEQSIPKFGCATKCATHRSDQSNASIGGADLIYFGRLVGVARNRYEEARHDYCYNSHFNSIEAYWLAVNCGDGFDDVPEIEVDGDISTFGSPFSDEDTSGVIF